VAQQNTQNEKLDEKKLNKKRKKYEGERNTWYSNSSRCLIKSIKIESHFKRRYNAHTIETCKFARGIPPLELA